MRRFEPTGKISNGVPSGAPFCFTLRRGMRFTGSGYAVLCVFCDAACPYLDG
ncbi:hypothetical protein Z947_3184 [Sulfitobacter geojensis]|nr:hypothetical protein Z947_3184 [Sulfitobacter geojensis]